MIKERVFLESFVSEQQLETNYYHVRIPFEDILTYIFPFSNSFYSFSTLPFQTNKQRGPP